MPNGRKLCSWRWLLQSPDQLNSPAWVDVSEPGHSALAERPRVDEDAKLQNLENVRQLAGIESLAPYASCRPLRYEVHPPDWPSIIPAARLKLLGAVLPGFKVETSCSNVIGGGRWKPCAMSVAG